MDGDLITVEECGDAYGEAERLHGLTTEVQEILVILSERGLSEAKRKMYNEQLMEKSIELKAAWKGLEHVLGWRLR